MRRITVYGRAGLFFFIDTATTEIYTLPYTTLFRSPVDEQSAELQETPAIADALTAELAIRLDGAEARRLTTAVGAKAAPAALLLPMRTRDQTYVLVLAGDAV